MMFFLSYIIAGVFGQKITIAGASYLLVKELTCNEQYEEWSLFQNIPDSGKP